VVHGRSTRTGGRAPGNEGSGSTARYSSAQPASRPSTGRESSIGARCARVFTWCAGSARLSAGTAGTFGSPVPARWALAPYPAWRLAPRCPAARCLAPRRPVRSRARWSASRPARARTSARRRAWPRRWNSRSSGSWAGRLVPPGSASPAGSPGAGTLARSQLLLPGRPRQAAGVHSSAVRALALQARGHWFDPSCAHEFPQASKACVDFDRSFAELTRANRKTFGPRKRPLGSVSTRSCILRQCLRGRADVRHGTDSVGRPAYAVGALTTLRTVTDGDSHVTLYPPYASSNWPGGKRVGKDADGDLRWGGPDE
jgi:hypothetical protein